MLFIVSRGKKIDMCSIEAEIIVDSKRRVALMRNNTAAHLLTMVMKESFVVSLQSLVVTEKDFLATFSIYNQVFSDEGNNLLINLCLYCCDLILLHLSYRRKHYLRCF